MSPFGQPDLSPAQRERVEATLRFARRAPQVFDNRDVVAPGDLPHLG